MEREISHEALIVATVCTLHKLSRSARLPEDNRLEYPLMGGADGLEAATHRSMLMFSMDQLRSVFFIMRRARAIAFLQRFVPEKYLPPTEDRIPSSLLKRLIHESKKLIPKWKWTLSARTLPRSPAKLGEEFFYAIAALRMSRLELCGRATRIAPQSWTTLTNSCIR
jgi:hypothetical protein